MNPPREHLNGARAAHRRLVDGVTGIDDDVVARPSLLPDWTVGHVLTHLARNADSHVRILEAAEQGKVVDQYPGGAEKRRADIEAGAGRSAADILDDLRVSCARLERTWDVMAPEDWSGHGRMTEGEVPVSDLPFRRWREVEVHHADLGLGFTWRDWSADYVAAELPRVLATVPERVPAATARQLAAWLLGRASQPDLAMIAPWQREHRPRQPL
jgi:maleylpyruvate isomerase